MTDVEFRYFSPVKGRAVARFGTDAVIGARRTPTGYEWNEDAIVPIPADEVRRHTREYSNALKGSPRTGPHLRERTREEYEASLKKGGDELSDDELPPDEIPTVVPEELAARSTGSRKKKKKGNPGGKR